MENATVYLLVTVSAFFWGANFVLAGPIMADLPPLWAAAVRFMLAAALMFTIAGVRREDLFGMLKRHAPKYFLLGAVGISGFNLFFESAVDDRCNHHSLGLAGLLLQTQL